MARSGRRSTRRGRARPIRAIVATLVLGVAGFGAGLLVGATWEEPELVLGYLRGTAEPVPLQVLAEAEPRERPAAGSAAASATRRERPPGPSRERAAPAPARDVASGPPVSAPRAEAAGPFSVQVGSFTEPIPAFRLAEDLGEKDYEVYVAEGSAAGQPRWRVRVGPVPSREAADRLADRLKSRERLPTWVLREEESG